MFRVITAVFILIVPFSLSSKKRKKKPVPPYGVHLYDNIYIDKTETANIHWMEFLHFIKLDSTKGFYKKCLPDTSIYTDFVLEYPKQKSTSEKSYLRDPSFRYFPVVGITKQQAKYYCQWRSDVINDKWAKELGALSNYKITYRLPTKKEWEYAARANLNPSIHPLGYKKIRRFTTHAKAENQKAHKYLKANLKTLSKKEKIEIREYLKSNERQFNCIQPSPLRKITTTRGTWHIYDGPENALGIYHMVDNVSEFVQENGIIKGGSWRHQLEKVSIDQNFPLSDSSAIWVGFRCIAEVELIEK